MSGNLQSLRNRQFDGHGSLTTGQRLLGEKTLPEILTDLIAAANIQALTSAATGGGAATEADLAVAGLLATDEILSITPIGGGASVSVNGFTNLEDGEIDIIFSADPTAGRTVKILVRKLPL